MLTAMILNRPMRAERIPEAMTMRHKGNPKLLTLVAVLFKLPKILKPKMIMDKPRNTKPDSLLNSGQFLA